MRKSFITSSLLLSVLILLPPFAFSLSFFLSFLIHIPYSVCRREALVADMGVPPPTDTSAPLVPPNPAPEDRAEDPVLPETNIGHQGETDV